jgi:hypothetical protein
MALPDNRPLLNCCLQANALIAEPLVVFFEELPRNIREALAVSLSEPFEDIVVQSSDRLPLSRAKREADSFGGDRPEVFMTHVLSSWIFGQHVYWSVGRGLGDARERGKTSSD